MARPTIYTPKLGHRICKLIADGWSVLKITRRRDMPSARTIYDWVLDEDKKEFSHNYARAREAQAEKLFDEILEIADEAKNVMVGDKSDSARVQARNLAVDARKWYLSKVLPKKFGEKMDLTSDGKAIVGNTIVFSDFKNETASK